VEDDALALEAVQQGAQDYLVKGQINYQLLTRAIRHAIERKQMHEQLHFSATHDPLTNLPNRTLFQDRLAHALQRSCRQQRGKAGKWEVAVILLDLDDFKAVNDTFGHAYGDLLLQAVAERLQDCVRRSDTVARMGGDEFTVIFENISGQQDYHTLAEKILEVFAWPFEVADQVVTVTASVGISLYPQDGDEYEALFKHADIAMYAARQVCTTFRCFSMRKST
jgi:two-component system cell cycle response regulator